jgi:uncharacterized protein YdaU (DUF1376 family)
MKWYKRDPDAFIAGTAELTLEEIGAYSFLLDLLYSRDGAVPDDDAFVSRNMRINPRTWRAIRERLIAKGKIWRTEDGNLTAKRVEYTLNEARNFSEKQSNRARTRWQQSEKPNDNSAPGMPSAALPSTTTTTTTTTAKKEGTRASARAPLADITPEFTRFYEAYPHKVGKLRAVKEFATALRRGVTVETILAGLARYIASKPADRQWLNPATFLHQGRWEDQPAAVAERPTSAADQRKSAFADALTSLDRFAAGGGDQEAGMREGSVDLVQVLQDHRGERPRDVPRGCSSNHGEVRTEDRARNR